MILNELVGAVVQVLLFTLIPFIVWLIFARKTEKFFSWIGLKKPICENVLKLIAISAAVAVVYITAMILITRNLPEGVTTAGSEFAGKGGAALPAVIFYAIIRTALSEEILFRGFILKIFQRKFGFVVGNTVQAVLFGLMHGVPFGIATKSVVAFLLLTLLPGLIGWYEGWMNEKKCGGSIIPGWILHSCFNLATGILTLF